jgi:putative ABC transport system permease protein
VKVKFEVAESIESLLQHKLRTLLTLLGMIFGVGAVIAMLSIGRGAEREALQLIDTMGLRNIIVKAKTFEEAKLKEIRENSPGLTLQDLNAARETLPFLNTSSASKLVKTYSILSEAGESDADVWGVTPTHLEMANLGVSGGRFLLPFDDVVYAHICVIGSRVAQVLFPGQDAIGKHVKINHVWMTVVGVLKDKSLIKDEFQGIALKGEQNNIYIPLQTALKVFRFGPYESDIDEFRVQLKSEVSSGTAAATLSHLMRRRHKEIADYELIVPEALLEQHRKTQNIFTIVMACIAGISLLVGGIGIMNIMLVSVTERTREIGIRKALGASPGAILGQFMTEAVTLSIVGGIIGMIVGTALSSFGTWLFGWDYTPNPMAYPISMLFAGSVGIFFGLYPAVRASRLNPVDALNYE